MIYVNIDMGDLLSMSRGFDSAVKKAMSDAARDLTVQTHAHIVEEVNSKLHSTREKFLENLTMKQVDADTWVIELAKGAMFIEEGIKPNMDMLDGLLKSSKAKTAKDGSRYIVVPFEHKKGPTQSTPAQQTLTKTVRAAMAQKKIPYGGLETGANGKPKLGLLHSFDIMHGPPKTGQGVGQGHGPVGAPKQGPTGIPFLQGVRVYQNVVKDKAGKVVKDKKGNDKVAKSIVTFRIASSKMKGQGRWVHPGLTAKKFLDEAAKWALETFENEIRDKILISVVNGI